MSDYEQLKLTGTSPEIRAAEAAAEQIANLQEQLAATMQALIDTQAQVPKAPEIPSGSITFFSSVPFCTVHIMRGPGYCEGVQFIAGRFETDDPVAVAALLAIADKQGSTISLANPENTTAEVQAMRLDVNSAAVFAHNKMRAAGLSTG